MDSGRKYFTRLRNRPMDERIRLSLKSPCRNDIRAPNKENPAISVAISVLRRNALPTATPKPPQIAAKAISGYRRKRIVFDILIIGVVNEANADNETMISRILLVRAAWTAAEPSTMPPTIPSVLPTFVGNLAPASRNNSSVISRKRASSIGENGPCVPWIR